MNPVESKVFLNFMVAMALIWVFMGTLLFRGIPNGTETFYSVFWVVVLDLTFLILLFWKLFFSPPGQPGRTFQVFVYFTFKLVCLGFLAITLKRLRNDPHLPAGFAVLFMGFAPVVSAIAARKWIRTKQG
jgi:drug/metabolite transporter (DMT)-like permease